VWCVQQARSAKELSQQWHATPKGSIRTVDYAVLYCTLIDKLDCE